MIAAEVTRQNLRPTGPCIVCSSQTWWKPPGQDSYICGQCWLQRDTLRNQHGQALIYALQFGQPIGIKPGTKEPMAEFAEATRGSWVNWDWEKREGKEFLELMVPLTNGVAVRLGERAAAIDLDTLDDYYALLQDHPELENYPTVSTPRPGRRILFEPKKPLPKILRINDPEDPTYDPLRPSYEIHGSGHLSMLPPSKHPNGKRYEWLVPPGDSLPPLWLAEWDGGTSSGSKKEYHVKPLSPKVQAEVEEILMRRLPGAKKQGKEIVGWLNPDSKSKRHININLEKNAFIDWHSEKGGTIAKLLKLLGVALPPELKGMGKPGIPEYMPIWVWRRDWRKAGYQCGDVISILRRDGKPFWHGGMYCLQWRCAECALRLIGIYKARLADTKASIFEAQMDRSHIAKALAKVRRLHPDFQYLRVMAPVTGLHQPNREYIVVKNSAPEIGAALVNVGVNIVTVSLGSVVEGLPHAAPPWKIKRVVASRGFWEGRVTRAKKDSKYNNSNKDDQPVIDMVVMKREGAMAEITEKIVALTGGKVTETALWNESNILEGAGELKDSDLSSLGEVIEIRVIDRQKPKKPPPCRKRVDDVSPTQAEIEQALGRLEMKAKK